MKLKTSIKNHLLLLGWVAFLGSLFLVGAIIINHVASTYAAVILYGIQLLPQVILHIKYYLKNGNSEYDIDREKIIIIGNEEKIIQKEDIKGIKLVKPAVLDDGWYFQTMGLQSYYYLKMTLKNDEIFYFTNLLDPNIDKIFKEYGYSFYREKGFGWF